VILPDRTSAVADASGAARLFDALLLTGSVGAFLLAAAVAILLLVIVARLGRGADAFGLSILMFACGLGAVGLGLVAFESGGWSMAFGALATAAPSARGGLLAAASDSMAPIATAALLIAMAIPVALVPARGRIRIAIGLVAFLVAGFAVGASAAAYDQKTRVEKAS
jgi:hypothetical protein